MSFEKNFILKSLGNIFISYFSPFRSFFYHGPVFPFFKKHGLFLPSFPAKNIFGKIQTFFLSEHFFTKAFFSSLIFFANALETEVL